MDEPRILEKVRTLSRISDARPFHTIYLTCTHFSSSGRDRLQRRVVAASSEEAGNYYYYYVIKKLTHARTVQFSILSHYHYHLVAGRSFASLICSSFMGFL